MVARAPVSRGVKRMSMLDAVDACHPHPSEEVACKQADHFGARPLGRGTRPAGARYAQLGVAELHASRARATLFSSIGFPLNSPIGRNGIMRDGALLPAGRAPLAQSPPPKERFELATDESEQNSRNAD